MPRGPQRLMRVNDCLSFVSPSDWSQYSRSISVNARSLEKSLSIHLVASPSFFFSHVPQFRFHSTLFSLVPSSFCRSPKGWKRERLRRQAFAWIGNWLRCIVMCHRLIESRIAILTVTFRPISDPILPALSLQSAPTAMGQPSLLRNEGLTNHERPTAGSSRCARTMRQPGQGTQSEATFVSSTITVGTTLCSRIHISQRQRIGGAMDTK